MCVCARFLVSLLNPFDAIDMVSNFLVDFYKKTSPFLFRLNKGNSFIFKGYRKIFSKGERVDIYLTKHSGICLLLIM